MSRIALISEHASPLAALGGVDSGGQNVYVAHLARLLAARGHDVEVLTRRDRPDQPESVRCADGVTVVHVAAGPPAFVRKEDLLPHMDEFTRFVLRRMGGRGAYDLIHANFFMSGLVAADVKRVADVPFVITFHALGRVRLIHQDGADTFPPERLAIESRVAAEADAVIAECPQDEDDLIRQYGADPSRIAVIPCGFDPSEFRPMDRRGARAELGLDPDEKVVLQLGRMVPRKGVDNVIRAVARLRHDHGILARLLVVGGDSPTPDPERTPEIGRLAAIARDERIRDAVTFVGSRGRDVLRYYYAAADVFVSTPWYEPFGITPLEAMACGTPVIGSSVGGIRHTVVDGETGYLVTPKDPWTLADRLARVLGDPVHARALGDNAIRRVNGHFTWRHVAGSVDDLYCRVLDRRRYLAKPARRRPAGVAIGVRGGLNHPDGVLTTHHGVPTSCVPG
jgi:glycosyltransferase involved in cell wall biosynthesis